MNENKELLVLIHDNTKMGLTSTQKLLTLIKDKNNKIKNILENELKEYTAYYKECKRLMKKNKIKIEHTEFLIKITLTLKLQAY